MTSDDQVLRTTAGDLTLEEYNLRLDGHAWKILHTGAVISRDDEQRYLDDAQPRLPYGIVLWPAAIALAHELATRDLRGKRVLELGAGTGLPGIVAASLGANVVQTDRHEVALFLCKKNARRNAITTIEHRAADWTAWDDDTRYDVILGADILYGDGLHPHLRAIFDRNLAPGGEVLLSDPFRAASFSLLEVMEAEGWVVTMNKWTVGATPPPRAVGVFSLRRGGRRGAAAPCVRVAGRGIGYHRARVMLEPKVVFATDLEGDLDEGLRVATRLARDRVATLVLLHVAPLRAESGDGMLHESLGLASGRAARALEALEATDPSVPVERLLEVGDPDVVIPNVVAREGAALLVMELRDHWLRRSLVQVMSARVECPIVTYRARARARQRDEPRPQARDEAPSSARGGVPAAVRLEMLENLLDARVLALVTWLEHGRDAARRIATSAVVRDLCASLLRGSESLSERHRSNLRLVLGEHQQALGAIGVEASAPDGASVLSLGARAPGDAARRAFEEKARREGSAISLPRDVDPGASDATYVIEVAATVPLPGGPPGLLVLTFDARRDFLRILAQPGPTPSTETYAFDERGIMLSNSHFPSELRRLGVLPDDLRVQTPGRVVVREPTRGGAEPTLTRMAAAATSGADGRDDAGYRDYRGVVVVGVWRWIPELGFGVAAEMDRDEPAGEVASERRRR